MTLSAGVFFDRHRFAGDHRFVDRCFALDDLAVGRDLFICFDAKRLADMNVAKVDDLFACRRRE